MSKHLEIFWGVIGSFVLFTNSTEFMVISFIALPKWQENSISSFDRTEAFKHKCL
jgi:hypothetical protein